MTPPRWRHGGDLERAAAAYGLPPERFLDFSASLSPLGPPDRVLAALRRALPLVARYPDPEAAAARSALAARLGVSPAAVLLTNGGSEAIHLAVRALLRPPARLVVAAPAFSEYERAAAAVRAEVVRVPQSPVDAFRLDPDALAAPLRPGDLLLLGNPNNPTGALLDAGPLAALARQARAAGAALAVDEAFLGFVAGGDGLSLARAAAAEPGLVVVGSLTKLYGLPGLRLGYLVAAPELLDRLAAAQPAWSVNGLAQVALLACLEDPDLPVRAAALVERERPRLAAALASLPGLRVFPSRANFLLVDCRGTGHAAAHLADALGRRGILIRDCADFPGLDAFYFRVAVRTAAENDRLVAELAGLMASRAQRLPDRGVPAPPPYRDVWRAARAATRDERHPSNPISRSGERREGGGDCHSHARRSQKLGRTRDRYTPPSTGPGR